MPQPAEIAGAHQADREAGLARRRAGQELAQRDEVGIGALVEPAPALDELGAEVAEMRDRPAEAGQPQSQEGCEHLGGGAARGRLPDGGRGMLADVPHVR